MPVSIETSFRCLIAVVAISPHALFLELLTGLLFALLALTLFLSASIKSTSFSPHAALRARQ